MFSHAKELTSCIIQLPQLADLNAQIEPLLLQTQERLQELLSQTSKLISSRYVLIDNISRLTGQLISIPDDPTEQIEPESTSGGKEGIQEQALSLLERLERAEQTIEALARGIKWISVLERVMLLARKTLDTRQFTPSSPSPLPCLPFFKTLDTFVCQLTQALPPSFNLLRVCQDVHRQVWEEIKSWGESALDRALDGIGWPGRGVKYEDVDKEKRREFERTFRELLILQLEGIKLKSSPGRTLLIDPELEQGLFPIKVMVKSVRQRFVFHFETDRGTNRLDKVSAGLFFSVSVLSTNADIGRVCLQPEWAFSSILDTIYEQRPFLLDYIQPLLSRTPSPSSPSPLLAKVDALSELIDQLLELPFTMLEHRLEHLYPHPPLLAHTIYQTVQFDENIKRNRWYELDRTWKGVRHTALQGESRQLPDWQGLASQLLSHNDAFAKWLQGEKEFAFEQYEEIMEAPNAWSIVDEGISLVDVVPTDMHDGVNEHEKARGLKPTIRARQVKALIEQVAGEFTVS